MKNNKEIALETLQSEIKHSVEKYLRAVKEAHGRIITHSDKEYDDIVIDFDQKRYMTFAIAVTIDTE